MSTPDPSPWWFSVPEDSVAEPILKAPGSSMVRGVGVTMRAA